MAQSASTRPKKARMSKSKIKSMLICFFESKDFPYRISASRTNCNQFYCCDIFERLRKRVVRVRASIADNWMLHHDNAPCHTAICVIEFLAKKDIPVVPQRPYSPDLSTCYFFLFPKSFTLKDAILGRRKTSKKL